MPEFLIGLAIVLIITVALQLLVGYLRRRQNVRDHASFMEERDSAISKYLTEIRQRCSEYTRIGSGDIVLDLRDYYVEQGIRQEGVSGLISLEQLLLGEENKWVIEGDAGLGKTTLLNVAVLHCISDKRIPILVKLDQLAALGRNEADFLEEHLRKDYGATYGSNLDLLGVCVERGGAVFLDGFDEVEVEKLDWIMQTVAKLSTQNPKVQVIVTSRPMNRRRFVWPNIFRRAELLRFSEDDIYRFARGWLAKSNSQILPEIVTLVDGSDRVRDLLRTPLFLELALYVIQDTGLRLVNRRVLLEKSVDLMLGGGAADSRLRHSSKFTALEKENLLTRVAHELVGKNLAILDHDTILSIMKTFLREERQYPAPEADWHAPALLEDLLFRNSLFRITAHGYEFLHRVFRDFFVARSLQENADQELANRIGESEWAEVCLLLLGRSKDPTKILIAAYDKSDNSSAKLRLTANAIIDDIKFDYKHKAMQAIVADIFSEKGVQELFLGVLERVFQSLSEDDRASVREKLKEKYVDRPDVLAVLQEVTRVLEATQESTRSAEIYVPKGQKIRIIGERQAPLEALREIVGKFQEKYKIDVELVLDDVLSVTEKVSADFDSGQESEFDVIIQPHRRLGALVTNGHVQPINQYLESEHHLSGFKPKADLFIDWWKEMSWFGGICYGFPILALSMYLWLRKDLLEDERYISKYAERFGKPLSFPKNLYDIRNLAKFFTRPEENLYGILLQGKSRQTSPNSKDTTLHPGLYHEWLNFLYAFGGRVLEQEYGWEYGPIVVNSPEAVRATEFYASLYDETCSHPKSQKTNWDDVPRIMKEKEAFMCVMWNDAVYEVVNCNKKGAAEFTFALLPSVGSERCAQSDGWSMFIPSRAKHPELSFKFMEWVLQENVQVEMQRRGGASPVRSVYSDEKVKALPYTKTSMEAMELRVPRETIPESEAMWKALTIALEDILHEGKPVAARLDEVAEQLEKEILKGKTYRRYPRETSSAPSPGRPTPPSPSP
uniref:Maltose-binding protein MalE n=1 Tax=Candidatus Kentrum sp. DK TaxID=2126562 RepID=A0A450SN70_9GAMM|nr:MAG: Maltose-binding protein MalE [Candidatus Kentron sp. DK]